MNIDIIYQGKNYNFDLRKDVTLKYIQDLASKLIKKDCSSFELFYKNYCFSDYEDTILMKDLVKDDNDISILIIEKDKNNNLFFNNSKKKVKKKKIDLEKSINSVNINNLKILLNTPIISPINSKNTMSSQHRYENKKEKNRIEYISENKVFEIVYNLKENEIFSLMKNLSQKIKKYDDILYKKFKKNNKNNNSELSSYEKI